MRYRLDLVLKPVEGALVRVIGMTERRGFAPRAISGGPDGDGIFQVETFAEDQGRHQGIRDAADHGRDGRGRRTTTAPPAR